MTLVARVPLALVLLTLVASGSLQAADWPQWQGPARDGSSTETGLLQEWPAGGPPLVWSIDTLGGGYSAPAIVGGRMYGLSSRGDDEVVWCLSESDGKELWATRIAPALREGRQQGSEGSGCTPTVDGQQVYVLGLGGVLACLQADSGQLVWQRSIVADFGGQLPAWRYNESPLVDGNKIVCTPGGPDATVIALNKDTGELIWKSRVAEQTPASPPGGGRGGGNRPSFVRMDPVLSALDADSDQQITTAELEQAPAALQALDKNQDEQLTEEEVRLNFGNRGPGGGGGGRGEGGRGGRERRDPFKVMPALKALDSNEDARLDMTEINASTAALATLDKNSDGVLTEDEVAPQMGRGGPSSGAGYASAIAIDVDGLRQYVQFTATTLVGLSADDGKELWRYDRPANANRINCTTPLYRDGVVVAASAYGTGGGAVRLTRQGGDAIQADEVWFSNSMQNHHGGMIVVGDCLYGANGGNGGGFLTCLDFETGEVLWRSREAPKGALIFADNRLYLYTEEGTALLIEPSRQEYLERGRFEHPQRSASPAWTHPVLANGKLYLRDQNALFCYDVTSH